MSRSLTLLRTGAWEAGRSVAYKHPKAACVSFTVLFVLAFHYVRPSPDSAECLQEKIFDLRFSL